MLGFKIDENMVGTHNYPGNEGLIREVPFQYNLTWGNKNLFKFLSPFSDQFLCGEARGILT